MTNFKSPVLREAEERGLLFQSTNFEELDDLLAREKVAIYLGTDPTADSMHIGHLCPLMVMRIFQKHGHKPIMLVGGATGMIGDPSFRDKSRPMMTMEQINHNKEGLKRSISKFLKFGDGPSDAVMVDNYDWLGKLNYLEFLRDIGPHFSVNRMLTFESVRLRLDKEEHMSFLEFNYMVLQGYDFYHLSREMACSVQLCGADQWGNVVAGVELTRRLNFLKGEEKRSVYGVSCPLLLKADGTKMGKSAGGAVWVNEDRLSPYDYFQFFRNVADDDVVKYLQIYTEIPMEEIGELAKFKSVSINDVKKKLAYEATKMCHGEAAAQEALAKAEAIFEEMSFGDMPLLVYETETAEPALFAMLRDLGLATSGGEARKLIKNGAVRINGEKIEDENFKVDESEQFQLSVGKKKFFRVDVRKI